MGDLTVHNAQWLQHSRGETLEGLELEAVCASQGLKHYVKEATRGDYLLDLVLSDLGSCLRCSVHPGIIEKDHRSVLCHIDISIPATPASSRTTFDFGKAKWKELRHF